MFKMIPERKEFAELTSPGSWTAPRPSQSRRRRMRNSLKLEVRFPKIAE